jgi:hypothetical protein
VLSEIRRKETIKQNKRLVEDDYDLLYIPPSHKTKVVPKQT